MQYHTHSLYSDPEEYRYLFNEISPDFEAVTSFIKQLLIHPVDARAAGVRFNSKNVMRQHVFNRTVPDILGMPKLAALIKTGDFSRSCPSGREILSCDHHSLLFLSIMREHRIEVRMRSGIAYYLIPDRPVCHWVCEIFRGTDPGWELVDPERRMRPSGNGEFLNAGKSWLQARAGLINTADIGVVNRQGWNALKYLLLSDANAIMKNEMLHYDWMITHSPENKPKLFSKPFSTLQESELDTLDNLAMAVSENDFHQVEAIYRTVVKKENIRR